MDLKIAKSDIHGSGCFALRPFKKGEFVNTVFTFTNKERDGLFCDLYKQGLGGAYTNHSDIPNCEIVKTEKGLALQALKEIKRNDEVTANYKKFIELFDSDETLIKQIKFW